MQVYDKGGAAVYRGDLEASQAPCRLGLDVTSNSGRNVDVDLCRADDGRKWY